MTNETNGNIAANTASTSMTTEQHEWETHPSTKRLKAAEAKLRAELVSVEAQLQQVVEENGLLQRLNTSLNACALGHVERSLPLTPDTSEHSCVVARTSHLPAGGHSLSTTTTTSAKPPTTTSQPPKQQPTATDQPNPPLPSLAQARRHHCVPRLLRLLRRLAKQVVMCSLAVAVSHTEQGKACVAAARKHPAVVRVATTTARALRRRTTSNGVVTEQGVVPVQQGVDDQQQGVAEPNEPCQQIQQPLLRDEMQEVVLQPSPPVAATGDQAVVTPDISE